MACNCIDKMRFQLSEQLLKEKRIDTIGLPDFEHVLMTYFESGNSKKQRTGSHL